MKKSLRNKSVLLTGGANGIGLELSLLLVKEKCTVIVWDNKKDALKALEARVRSLGEVISTTLCDIGVEEDVLRNSELLLKKHGHLDVIINNAGIVYGSLLEDETHEEIKRVLDVNLLSHFWIVKAFLRDMSVRNDGHIVTVSSVAGMMGMSRLSDYCASKFGVFGFAESLRRELKASPKTNRIKTTIVCPWITRSGMFDGIRELLLPSHDPKYVAHQILEAIQLEQELLILPSILHLLPPSKLLPTYVLDWMGSLTRADHAIDEFRGRGKEWCKLLTSIDKLS